MPLTTPLILAGDVVRLEPLRTKHTSDLERAAREFGDAGPWYTSVPAPAEVAAAIQRRLSEHAAGRMNPWAVRDAASGRTIGMTTFCNIDEHNRRVEIGYTWLAPSAQRSGINTEAKLLLLTHAFEGCDTIAVEFRTHWHNRQSRAAIERLGARPDGVLRNHSISADGVLRDTVVYSVLPHEWPAVRTGLRARLAAHAR
ncbi:GNAT family protein [Microbacterium limosum]|uniref:GNAT family protein n=1 Tax=Microbacterium limosum TaxID=3079935 RepID=A0AAU0MFP9_9MICO|nr:GNAT family protein [Microbacterium sp. Y20]WOQ68847.1 GNAT family protein [Microbacterium sp. Y20]